VGGRGGFEEEVGRHLFVFFCFWELFFLCGFWFVVVMGRMVFVTPRGSGVRVNWVRVTDCAAVCGGNLCVGFRWRIMEDIFALVNLRTLRVTLFPKFFTVTPHSNSDEELLYTLAWIQYTYLVALAYSLSRHAGLSSSSDLLLMISFFSFSLSFVIFTSFLMMKRCGGCLSLVSY
jgi:hypothetical protein